MQSPRLTAGRGRWRFWARYLLFSLSLTLYSIRVPCLGFFIQLAAEHCLYLLYTVYIQEPNVSMIITDYWMPEMTGYDLLKKVKVIINH